MFLIEQSGSIKTYWGRFASSSSPYKQIKALFITTYGYIYIQFNFLKVHFYVKFTWTMQDPDIHQLFTIFLFCLILFQSPLSFIIVYFSHWIQIHFICFSVYDSERFARNMYEFLSVGLLRDRFICFLCVFI